MPIDSKTTKNLTAPTIRHKKFQHDNWDNQNNSIPSMRREINIIFNWLTLRLRCAFSFFFFFFQNIKTWDWTRIKKKKKTKIQQPNQTPKSHLQIPGLELPRVILRRQGRDGRHPLQLGPLRLRGARLLPVTAGTAISAAGSVHRHTRDLDLYGAPPSGPNQPGIAG